MELDKLSQKLRLFLFQLDREFFAGLRDMTFEERAMIRRTIWAAIDSRNFTQMAEIAKNYSL